MTAEGSQTSAAVVVAGPAGLLGCCSTAVPILVNPLPPVHPKNSAGDAWNPVHITGWPNPRNHLASLIETTCVVPDAVIWPMPLLLPIEVIVSQPSARTRWLKKLPIHVGDPGDPA